MLKVGDLITPVSDEALHKFDVYQQEIVKIDVPEQGIVVAVTNHGLTLDAYADETENVLVVGRKETDDYIKESLYKFLDERGIRIEHLEVSWCGHAVASMKVSGEI